MFRFGVITLFPEYFESPTKASLLGKALNEKRLEITFVNPRGFAEDKFGHVDDTPFGGGAGMILQPKPLLKAIQVAKATIGVPHPPVILLSARGKCITQTLVRSLVPTQGLVLICGRYEGVDDRLLNFIDHEISVGDVVTFGGEAAALVLIEAIARLVPGVVGHPLSLTEESFENGLLEYPQFTRPRTFQGYKVPSVLLSGHHEKIRAFRSYHALLTTFLNRPDLLTRKTLNVKERYFLEKIRNRRYPYIKSWIKKERGTT